MKKGLIALTAVFLLFVIYTPVSLSMLLKEHNERAKRKTRNNLYGIMLKGKEQKTVINQEEFLDYSKDADYINDFSVSLWHENDTLYVEVNGEDGYPFLRKMKATSALDLVNEMTHDDKFTISIDENRTNTVHKNYHFSFGKFLQVADNKDGEYVKGSRREGEIPWKFDINGKEYKLYAAIPLYGSKKIGLNLKRKFYGGRNVELIPGNLPGSFYLVNII